MTDLGDVRHSGDLCCIPIHYHHCVRWMHGGGIPWHTWPSAPERLPCFGLDSAIEGLGSVIIVWRFTGSRTLSHTAEERAQKAVAVTFFLLAPYIAYNAITTLIARTHAATSWLGIGLAIASLIVMPVLGVPSGGWAAAWAPRPPPVRAPRTCCARTSPQRCWLACWQHPVRLVVAGPGCRARYRRPRRLGGHRGMARRGMLLTCRQTRRPTVHTRKAAATGR